jgi:hypothetical protein
MNFYMVIVSEKSVKRMIEDVAPKVERLTGWDTNLDDLEVRIIGRDQYWEHGILSKYNHLGINTEAKTAKGKKSTETMKALMPFLVLGQYEPLSGRMFVIPDNLRFGTNESGLTATIGHELVHRCQFVNNPRFANLYSQLVRRSTGDNAFDEDPSGDKRVKPYLQAYMTLVEGDATFTEEQLKKMFYQDAKNKTSHMSNFLGLVLALSSIGNGDKGFMQKLKQYEQGKKKVRAVYERGGRGEVNALYNLEELGLRRVFGK